MEGIGEGALGPVALGVPRQRRRKILGGTEVTGLLQDSKGVYEKIQKMRLSGVGPSGDIAQKGNKRAGKGQVCPSQAPLEVVVKGISILYGEGEGQVKGR